MVQIYNDTLTFEMAFEIAEKYASFLFVSEIVAYCQRASEFLCCVTLFIIVFHNRQ